MKNGYPQNRNAHRKNKTVAIIVAILLVGIAAFTLWFYYTQSANNTGSTGPSLEEQQAAKKISDAKKDSLLENKDDTQTTPPATDSSIELTAKKESSSTVVVYTKLLNTPDGTCSLAIKNGSSAYTKSASVIYQNTYSSCAGFSIPIDQLKTGTWAITLTVTVPSGQETSKTISLQVD